MVTSEFYQYLKNIDASSRKQKQNSDLITHSKESQSIQNKKMFVKGKL